MSEKITWLKTDHYLCELKYVSCNASKRLFGQSFGVIYIDDVCPVHVARLRVKVRQHVRHGTSRAEKHCDAAELTIIVKVTLTTWPVSVHKVDWHMPSC